MEFSTITVERGDQIGFLTLNRPDKMNTFSSQLARELNEGLRLMDQDDQVRVIIVKGAGRAFSTGIDIAEFPGKTASEYQDWISRMDEMHLTIAALAKPVIAMVHGFAVANGAGLLFAADFAQSPKAPKSAPRPLKSAFFVPGPSFPSAIAWGRKKSWRCC